MQNALTFAWHIITYYIFVTSVSLSSAMFLDAADTVFAFQFWYKGSSTPQLGPILFQLHRWQIYVVIFEIVSPLT